MPNALSLAERQSLAEKASKLEGLPVDVLLSFTDENLRSVAGDFSPEEMAERERDVPSEAFARNPGLSAE